VKMTARDVERHLVKTVPTLPEEVIDNLVTVFEEANYSLHPITRPAYEKMFLSVQEIGKIVIARP